MRSLLLLCFLSTPAHAHWGHVGELAGHGHVIGIGLLAGAAALAAALRKPRNDDEIDETDIQTDDDTAEEAAA